MQENNTQAPQTTNNNNNNSSKNNLLIIVGIVVAVIAVILVVVLVVKPGSSGTGGGGDVVNPNEQKITITGSTMEDNNVLVKIENNKVDTYDVVFELTVYNENKEAIRVFEETAHAVSPKSTAYHVVDTTGVLEDNYTYDMQLKDELKKDSSKIYSSKITHSETKLDDAIEVEITNTTKEEIDSVQITIAYYNAKEVINYTTQFIADFPADASIIETVYIPKDELGNTIKFDNYEVVINAYNHEN